MVLSYNRLSETNKYLIVIKLKKKAVSLKIVVLNPNYRVNQRHALEKAKAQSNILVIIILVIIDSSRAEHSVHYFKQIFTI